MNNQTISMSNLKGRIIQVLRKVKKVYQNYLVKYSDEVSKPTFDFLHFYVWNFASGPKHHHSAERLFFLPLGTLFHLSEHCALSRPLLKLLELRIEVFVGLLNMDGVPASASIIGHLVLNFLVHLPNFICRRRKRRFFIFNVSTSDLLSDNWVVFYSIKGLFQLVFPHNFICNFVFKRPAADFRRRRYNLIQYHLRVSRRYKI